MRWKELLAHHLIEGDIPALQELKKLPQWVLWKKVVRDGKITKIPYQADGRPAKANDPTTWSRLNDLMRVDESRFDGVGFVFTQQDGYIFIDLDHCLINGKAKEWAMKIVNSVDSYTEISPSGDGLHIITKGIIPNSWKNKVRFDDGSALEVYMMGRYATFTFNVYQGKTEIKPLTKEGLEALAQHLEVKEQPKHLPSAPLKSANGLSDEEIIERVRQRGFWIYPQDGDDWSALDMALCNELAFWTGKDPVQMDRIFRQSPLYRKKWDERHRSDGATYGQMTIDRAIRDVKDAYDPSRAIDVNPFKSDRPAIRSGSSNADIKSKVKGLAMHMETLEKRAKARHLFEGIIVDKGHTILVSPSGGFKTTLAMKMALEVAKGGIDVHYWAFDPNDVYLAAFGKILQENGVFERVSIIDNIRAFKEVYSEAIAVKADLSDVVIVIDTLKKVLSGVINKNTNVKDMHFLREITKLGASILSLHHTNKHKPNEQFKTLDDAGTSEIEQDSDGVLFVEHVDRGDYYLARISKKHRRVRFTTKPMCFKLVKYEPPKDTDLNYYEYERAYHFIKGVEILDECKEDIEKIQKIDADRFFIQEVQAFLRKNGDTTQKELVTYLSAALPIGKNSIMKKLQDKDYLGKFWKFEVDKKNDNRYLYRLIDTTQETIDRINHKLKNTKRNQDSLYLKSENPIQPKNPKKLKNPKNPHNMEVF